MLGKLIDLTFNFEGCNVKLNLKEPLPLADVLEITAAIDTTLKKIDERKKKRVVRVIDLSGYGKPQDEENE